MDQVCRIFSSNPDESLRFSFGLQYWQWSINTFYFREFNNFIFPLLHCLHVVSFVQPGLLNSCLTIVASEIVMCLSSVAFAAPVPCFARRAVAPRRKSCFSRPRLVCCGSDGGPTQPQADKEIATRGHNFKPPKETPPGEEISQLLEMYYCADETNYQPSLAGAWSAFIRLDMT